jgi:NADH:ubiquinone oxidoreductase subunit 3 (subunit A)
MRNLIKTYQEKDSMFECGFHSFSQSRSPFNIAFFIYALVYLLLDLEILLTFPFAVSEYVNNIYGLIITLGFIIIITIGFVFELGKGALKIPSKQYTYTIKTQPLIHISYIKAKSAQITKPDPFIVSSPLQSSIFPFTLSIKNFIKYLSFTNIIIGLISLTVIGLVKILHIPTYILGIFNLESLELLEYIIAGFFGLVSRLSLKGIVEGIFVDNYATMGGENPAQGGNSSLGSKGAGVSGTNTLNSDLAEKGKQGGSNPSGGNKPLESESSPEGASNTQTQSGGDSSPGVDTQKEGAGQSSSTYSPVAQFMAKRYTKIYDGLVNNLVEEVKRLTLEMDKAKDDQQKWDDLSSKREENFQQIQMVTEASAEEMKKYIPRDTSSTAAKRDLGDAALDKKEGEPSKKK